VGEHTIRQRRIIAPIGGIVTQVNRQRGEWVQPGQPIVRILRLDQVRAEGLASAHEVDGQLLGRPVKLTVELGQKPVEFSGKVVFVSPEVDPVNGQVRVWAEIDNRELKLRPGQHGSLTIEEAPSPSATR
jgi:macrolide-specific efflux system membrane fusion protein